MNPKPMLVGGLRAIATRIACMVGLLLLLSGLAACRDTPPEQQVRQAIEAAVAAARARDTGAVLEAVSDNFVGNDGQLDRRGLRRLLVLRALRQDSTGVLPGPISFEHRGDRIIAKFNLVLTGGKPGDLLPTQTAIYAMSTAWKLENGEWRCYSATWRR